MRPAHRTPNRLPTMVCCNVATETVQKRSKHLLQECTLSSLCSTRKTAQLPDGAEHIGHVRFLHTVDAVNLELHLPQDVPFGGPRSLRQVMDLQPITHVVHHTVDRVQPAFRDHQLFRAVFLEPSTSCSCHPLVRAALQSSNQACLEHSLKISFTSPISTRDDSIHNSDRLSDRHTHSRKIRGRMLHAPPGSCESRIFLPRHVAAIFTSSRTRALLRRCKTRARPADSFSSSLLLTKLLTPSASRPPRPNAPKALCGGGLILVILYREGVGSFRALDSRLRPTWCTKSSSSLLPRH